MGAPVTASVEGRGGASDFIQPSVRRSARERYPSARALAAAEAPEQSEEEDGILLNGVRMNAHELSVTEVLLIGSITRIESCELADKKRCVIRRRIFHSGRYLLSFFLLSNFALNYRG